MVELRFKLYHSLVAFSTLEDGPSFPLREGEKVLMRLEVGWIVPLGEDGQEVNHPVDRDSRSEVTLLPDGERVEGADYLWCQVTTAAGEQYRVKVLNDKDHVLRALVTGRGEVAGPPILPGQVVTAPLKVTDLKELHPLHRADWNWEAALSPSGTELDGLINAVVEPLQQ